jgi:hypothetical protein
MTEHQNRRTVTEALRLSRQTASASAVPRPATTAPTVLDELVEGAWETDGGRAIPTTQDQRSA